MLSDDQMILMIKPTLEKQNSSQNGLKSKVHLSKLA